MCTVAVLLMLGDMFVLWPVLAKLAELRHEIELKKIQVAQNESILAQADIVRTEIDKAFLYTVQKAPTGDEEERAIGTELESLARESGVRITQSKPQGVRHSEFEDEHIVRIEIEAETDKLILFLHGIQESLQLLRIKRMDLKASEKFPDTEIKATLVISKAVTV